METVLVNWDDIKCNNITTTKISNKKFDKKNSVKVDDSISINRHCCKTLTSLYAKSVNSVLVATADNNSTIFKFNGGQLDGKTVCIKVRSNTYNDSGNFTLTDEDLYNGLLAIYYYSGETHRGYWFITDMSNIRRLTSVMRKVKNFWICSENVIINNSFGSYELKFN